MRLFLLKFSASLLFVLVSVLAWSRVSFPKPADAKKTNKSCVYCHTKYGAKELTEAGKYYKANGTLDGYKPSK